MAGLYPSDQIYPSPELYPGEAPNEIAAPTFTDGILEDFSAWTTTDSTNYLTALGSMFETVFSIVNDVGDPDDPSTYQPGWSNLLDPNACPTEFLPYLGQFLGANIQPGAQDAAARSEIVNGCALRRGTVASMQWAAKQYLIGTQYLQIFERTAPGGTPDAYHMIIQFHNSECTSVSRLEAAVNAKKPAGIQITFQSSEGFTWLSATHEWAQDVFAWNTALTVQP